jgi:hypothetical protein
VVDRGFEDVEEEAGTRRVHWTIVNAHTADQVSRKPVSAVYVLQRDGGDASFPNRHCLQRGQQDHRPPRKADPLESRNRRRRNKGSPRPDRAPEVPSEPARFHPPEARPILWLKDIAASRPQFPRQRGSASRRIEVSPSLRAYSSDLAAKSRIDPTILQPADGHALPSPAHASLLGSGAAQPGLAAENQARGLRRWSDDDKNRFDYRISGQYRVSRAISPRQGYRVPEPCRSSRNVVLGWIELK